MEPINDSLWEIAKQRARFKKQLISYIIVNAFLWGIWFFSNYNDSYGINESNSITKYNLPWPAWVMLGWGIGLVFAYLRAYQDNTFFNAEKEYEKLKNETK